MAVCGGAPAPLVFDGREAQRWLCQGNIDRVDQ